MRGSEHPQVRSYGRNRRGSRFDRRFYAVALGVLAVAIGGEVAGADAFRAYPTVEVGLEPATLTVAALVALAGLAPVRRPVRRSGGRREARRA